jgi:ribosomal-protein-alanine N-acetyltransferase
MDISAINEVMNYGFNEMHLHSVEAIINPNNLGSAKVYKKTDYKKSSLENEFYEGRFLDNVIYFRLNKL